MGKGGRKLSHHALQIELFHAIHALGRQASWEETTLVTKLCWLGNSENRACKQERFHSILDGSSLAHSIQALSAHGPPADELRKNGLH